MVAVPGLAADSAVAVQAPVMPERAPETAISAAQPLLIRVDSRERQSPAPTLLAAFPDVTLSFAALPSADYLLSEDVAVERKSAGDFVASILDRRLFGQTTRMKVLFPQAMLIIEGDLTQVRSSMGPTWWKDCRGSARAARMLLAHFGSPAAIMCAAADELAKVPGIGKKSAQRIWQAVNARYAPENRDA